MNNTMTVNAPKRMTQREARACCKAIRGHLRECRLLLLDLYEQEGWCAMGYASWRECVAAEFEQSERHLYRLLRAAQVEKEISWEAASIDVPPLKESQARELARLPTADLRREVWAEANADGDVTAQAIHELVEERLREVDDEPRSHDQPPIEDSQRRTGGKPRPGYLPAWRAWVVEDDGRLRKLPGPLGDDTGRMVIHPGDVLEFMPRK